MKPEPLEKIVSVARVLFRERGYSSVRMDDIAHELGMSKKTLYLHVASKEALLEMICDDLRGEFARHSREVLNCNDLSLKEKLSRHAEFCNSKWNRLLPAFFFDVKRHAPAVYEKLMQLRSKGVARTISSLLKQGQKEGVVRRDISMQLAIESFRAMVLNVMQPEVLESINLTASQAGKEIMELFFNGILIRDRSRG
jgi:AcrR family transcriptional regulator